MNSINDVGKGGLEGTIDTFWSYALKKALYSLNALNKSRGPFYGTTHSSLHLKKTNFDILSKLTK